MKNLLIFTLTLIFSICNGKVRPNVNVYGITVPPNVKFKSSKAATICPNYYVALNKGSVCCQDGSRSSNCPLNAQNDVRAIQFDDPIQCCPTKKIQTCPGFVCVTEHRLEGTYCPITHPYPFDMGKRCCNNPERATTCSFNDYEALVREDPIECCLPENTIHCNDGGGKQATCIVNPEVRNYCEINTTRSFSLNHIYLNGDTIWAPENILNDSNEKKCMNNPYVGAINTNNIETIINMNCVKKITSLGIMQTTRKGICDIGTKNFQIYLSMDGIKWTEFFNGTLPDTTSQCNCDSPYPLIDFKMKEPRFTRHIKILSLDHYGSAAGFHYFKIN